VTKVISLPPMRKITASADAIHDFGLVKIAYPEYPPVQMPFNAGGFGAFSRAHL